MNDVKIATVRFGGGRRRPPQRHDVALKTTGRVQGFAMPSPASGVGAEAYVPPEAGELLESST